MINTNRGVKTWTEAKPNVETVKRDHVQTLAPDQEKLMDGKDVGEVLNQVADPNYVDPSKKLRGVGSDKMGKDAFMKLMLAQMKNQDPTNPLKSHEMAAQLAQFSQLEQLTNVNTTLEEIKSQQKPSDNFQALGLIGKSIESDSSQVIRNKGDKAHEIKYQLPQAASELEISIKNSNGEVVRKIKLTDQKPGEKTFNWNGHDDRDLEAPPGDYKISLEGKMSNGQKMLVNTQSSGTITGIQFSAAGPILLTSNGSVRMRDVRRITDQALPGAAPVKAPDSTPNQAATAMATAAAMGAPAATVAAIATDNKNLTGSIPSTEKGSDLLKAALPDLLKQSGISNTQDVAQGSDRIKKEIGLSRGMMNRLDQELGKAK